LDRTPKNISYTGRAKAVFVFGRSESAISVVSTVVAKVCDQTHGERLRFKGTSIFDKKTAQHIVETVFPTVDGVLKALGLPEKCFELSIVNIDVASMSDIGLMISGFSADVPIILAFISAALQIPIPGDIVSTGHIASTDGDIRIVKGIPAKILATIKNGSIRTFIYPSIDQDNSLNSFSPVEKQRIADAITRSRRDIRTIAVRDINELFQAVFSDNLVVLASLMHGFYKRMVPPYKEDTPSGKTAKFFSEDNENRFWKVLEQQILAGESNKAKELLLALTSFHANRKIYPKGLGGGFFNLVQSLPPERFRLKIDFPLLDIPDLTKLSQLAHESDYEDARLLFLASFGEKNIRIAQKVDLDLFKETMTGDQADSKFQSILSEIDADALTILFGIPIDSARATYIMDSVIARSPEEFNRTVASFYTHLLRHTRKVSGPINSKAAGAEALSLIERAFSIKGGFRAALAEAKHATNGGLRLVLDLMAEQFKQEEQEKHINSVLKSALDPLDWDGKVALMREVLKCLEPSLPQEIRSQPTERFAGHYEVIVNAYVQSINQLKTLFRTF